MSGDSGTQRSNLPLIISLCVNLVLVGLIATAVARFVVFHPMLAPPPEGFGGGPGMGHGQMYLMMAPHELMEAAPDKAAQISAIVEAHRAKIDELRLASFDARSEVARQFGAPQLDRKAFDQALLKMQSADQALEGEVLKVMAECAETLTPDERRALSMRRGGRGGGFGWRHHGGRRGFE